MWLQACAQNEAQSSGKARHRLLAWVVGDLIGKRLDGDKTVAETVGKRLERQAGRVRASIATVADSAESKRTEARAAAALAQDETQLADALKIIDADERVRINKLNHEIYINLHEYTVTAVAATETTELRLVVGPEEPESEPEESRDFDAEYSGSCRRRHARTCSVGAGRVVQCRLRLRGVWVRTVVVCLQMSSRIAGMLREMRYLPSSSPAW